MSSYILLRDNKETGPLSLDELIKTGLKPYDLIWEEGRCAAWKYASEIPALQNYAPVQEEQPYDRFYKRPAPEAPTPEFTDYEAKYIPPAEPRPVRKSVYVTMPETRTHREVKPAISAAPANSEWRPTVEEKISNTKLAEEPLTTQFSQPLDVLKDQYLQTLKTRNLKLHNRKRLLAFGKKAAVFAGILVIGVTIGYMVMGNNNSIEPPAPADKQSAGIAYQTLDTPDSTEELMPVESEGKQLPQNLDVTQSAAAVTKLEKPDPATVYSEPSQPPLLKPEKPIEKAIVKTQKEIVSATIETPVTSYGYEQPVHKSASAERSRSSRDDDRGASAGLAIRPYNSPQEEPEKSNSRKEEKKRAETIPENLKGLVNITSNDYKRVALGGIRDLRLTIQNNSPEELEKVVVELSYLKPNDEPLKKELVNFRAIASHSSSTIRMPDTNRGIKVQYRIVDVIAK